MSIVFFILEYFTFWDQVRRLKIMNDIIVWKQLHAAFHISSPQTCQMESKQEKNLRDERKI